MMELERERDSRLSSSTGLLPFAIDMAPLTVAPSWTTNDGATISAWMSQLGSASNRDRAVTRPVTSPPITKLGRSPASARISISIDVVVVLPWAPATPRLLAIAQIEANMPARRSTGTPIRRASSSSLRSPGIADE